jgi:1L-myo-inositol 1-phosphate cytidylyltransferase / CDP-L-myo-inositol myo-inositolphosphotransferase
VSSSPAQEPAHTPRPEATPPTVGVVLATGSSGVPGDLPAVLLSVGGMPLVERTVRMLLAEGLERVVVVVGRHAEATAEASRRADPDRVDIVRAEGAAGGDGALAAAEPAVAGESLFAVVSGEVVFSAGALRDLLRATGPAGLVDVRPSGAALPGLSIDGGAFVFDASIFERLRSAQSLVESYAQLRAGGEVSEVAVPTGAAWCVVRSPEDLREAGRMLRLSLIKPTDGPVSRRFNRLFSTRITMALSSFRLSPMLISVVAGCLGVAAGWALAWGYGLVGGLLIQANTIIDGCDGETARLHFRSSDRGASFDAVVDRVVDGSVVAGVALWLWPLDASLEFTVAILAASAYGWGFLAHLFQGRLTGLEVATRQRSLIMLLGGRDSRLLILSVGAILSRPGAALLVCGTLYGISVLLRVRHVARRRPRPAPVMTAPPDQVGEPPDRDLHEVG